MTHFNNTLYTVIVVSLLLYVILNQSLIYFRLLFFFFFKDNSPSYLQLLKKKKAGAELFLNIVSLRIHLSDVLGAQRRRCELSAQLVCFERSSLSH